MDASFNSTSGEESPRSLDSLPTEIHLAIVKYLLAKGKWRSLLRLRAVSKMWCNITTPYVDIPIGLEFEYDPEQYNPLEYASEEEDEDSPIHRVCFRLAQESCRPDFIKKLPRIDNLKPSWLFATLANTRENRMRLRRQLSTLDHTDLQTTIIRRVLGIEQRRALQADAQLAMVLAACTALEELQCPDVVTENFGRLSRQVIRRAAQQARTPAENGKAHMLGKLKQLGLSDVHKGIQVPEVLDMLSLPNLRDLRLEGVGNFKGTDRREVPYTPGNEKLAHLALNGCRNFDEQDLTRILAACPNIRSLFLHTPMLRSNASVPACFTGALAEHGQNLECLFLDTQRRDTGLAKVPGESQRLLRTLSGMRNLRTLALWRGDFGSAAALADALPSSLRELLIIGHYDVEVPYVEAPSYMEADQNTEEYAEAHAEPHAEDSDQDDEEDSDGEEEEEEEESTADRDAFYALVGHPHLSNLQRVEVVPTNRLECSPHFGYISGYCIDNRELPPRILGPFGPRRPL
ncbi:hypothetical protein F4818DRAFT_411927 [Hypoxylon cercidicola]|nr:hypothetical protein F4818DRAFT_411927 [Hypoxylon cercidicola]